MAKRGLLEVVEGFYLAHIVYQLYRRNVFERLAVEGTVTELASDLGYDEDLLRALLDFVYLTTDILLWSRSDRYRVNPKYLLYSQLGFQLDKFVGAYGPAFTHLEDSLCSVTLGKAFVNDEKLAQAFTRVETPGTTASAQILRAWGVDALLDLGCGPATLLLELGMADPVFRGWGVDANATMCSAGTERITKAGLASRLRIIHADVRQLETHLQPELRRQVDALHGRSILNEFFRRGSAEAVSFVGRVKELFPGRLLFVADYYGKLTRARATPLRYRHTLLHDMAQAISAQGVPLPDLQHWIAIYHAAGCSVEHAYEGENDGIEWFVHVVRL